MTKTLACDDKLNRQSQLLEIVSALSMCHIEIYNMLPKRRFYVINNPRFTVIKYHQYLDDNSWSIVMKYCYIDRKTLMIHYASTARPGRQAPSRKPCYSLDNSDWLSDAGFYGFDTGIPFVSDPAVIEVSRDAILEYKTDLAIRLLSKSMKLTANNLLKVA